jgi:hypothetical protein
MIETCRTIRHLEFLPKHKGGCNSSENLHFITKLDTYRRVANLLVSILSHRNGKLHIIHWSAIIKCQKSSSAVYFDQIDRWTETRPEADVLSGFNVFSLVNKIKPNEY